LTAGNNFGAITATVNVAANALPQVTNLVTVSGGGSTGFGAIDSSFVGPGTPVLEISSTHSGDFFVGENNATYTATVGNEFNASPTSGLITVSEIAPAGLHAVSMTGSAGSGWTCSGTSCTRNDALQGGGVFPPLTVTVNVTAAQAEQVINQVMVAGGGSNPNSATYNDPTVITAASCNPSQSGTAGVADVQLLINQALGVAQATDDLNGDGLVDVVDIQIVINAALGLGCTH
jgi:hypothetical protein